MRLSDLIDAMRAEAIADALRPTPLSVYRNLCRTYSRTFHTPLHVVEGLEPERVIGAVFAHQLDETNIEEEMEKLLEQIYQLEDPEYDAKAEKELAEFAAEAEAEEEARVEAGGKIGRKAPPAPTPPPDQPTEGSINFAALEASQDER